MCNSAVDSCVDNECRMMRWGEISTHQFVKIYLKYECLWNPEDSSYKTREAREMAYSSIAEEFKQSTGLSVSTCEVKRKIKNLRTTYQQMVNKILRRSQDPDYLYQPTLVWFHEMDACLKNIPNKHVHPSSHNVAKYDKRAPAEDKTDNVWVATTTETLPDEESRPDPLVPRHTSEPTPKRFLKVERRRSSSSAPLGNFKMKKKKRLKVRCISPVYNSSSDVDRLDTTVSTSTEDEFDIYGKYIALQLRSMELQKALRLQMEINTLVSGARLADVEEC